MDKKKMIYCLPVDWDWIKQRPQFLAQELSEYFNITAMYCWQYRRGNLQKNSAGNVNLSPIKLVPPLGNRFLLINEINQWICRKRMLRMIKRLNPEYIWLSYPLQINWVPSDYGGQIIYDCMDNHIDLCPTKAQHPLIREAENELCRRAIHIFCSSSRLKNQLCIKYKVNPDKVSLLNNGCNGILYPQKKAEHHKSLKLGYVGTISEWFDFDLIVESLQEMPELEYELIGPVYGVQPIQHERIHYRGVVAHEKLFDAIADVNCLIMPFVLNEVVEAVDPVKLYEYISWKKPIIAIAYSETERFEPFAKLYHTPEEYCDLLKSLKNSQVLFEYSDTDAEQFLSHSSWKARANEVKKQLDTLIY